MKGIMTGFNDDRFEPSGAIIFGMAKCVSLIKNNLKGTVIGDVTPRIVFWKIGANVLAQLAAVSSRHQLHLQAIALC
jgi:hypothetical protein